MSFENILVEKKTSIAYVTISRPKVAADDQHPARRLAAPRRLRRVPLIALITLAILLVVAVGVYIGAFVILSPMLG